MIGSASTEKPIVENVDKILEVIEVDRLKSSHFSADGDCRLEMGHKR